jgi:CheY-like chemotaxis protein
VRSILGDTGGRLEIASTERSAAAPHGPAGTVVTITWPEADAAAAATAPPAEVLLPRPCPATILLAEDDEQVRNVTRRALEGAGYHVLVPESSAQALELVRHHAGRIDLLLTDVVMPEVSGPQLAQATQALRRDTVIRFVSGFIDAEHRSQLPLDVPVLGKPFTQQALLRFVQTALARLPTAPRQEQPK